MSPSQKAMELVECYQDLSHAEHEVAMESVARSIAMGRSTEEAVQYAEMDLDYLRGTVPRDERGDSWR